MWLPPELQGVSPCSSTVPPHRSRRAARAARGASAVEHPEHDLRGAARAARPRHARPHAATRSAPSASIACACSCTGRTSRPRRTRKRARRFDATDPAPTRPARGTGSTRCSTAPRRAGSPSSSRSPGPVPRWATASARDNVTKPSPKEFEAFATAVGRRYGDRVGAVVDLERAEPPAVPAARSTSARRPASPRIYRKLFLAGQRGLAGVGQRRRHAADRRDGAARHPARRRAARVPARHAVPERSPTSARASAARINAGGYAHHAYTTRVGPRFRPPDHDDVTIGVLGRLTSALDRAGKAGAITRGARGLPDRVRHPELARPARRVARAAGRVQRDRRAHGVRQHARAVVLAVPAAATTSRARPAAASSATAASSPACGAPTARTSRPTPRSACRWRPRPTAPSDVLWGRVRPSATKTQVTILAQRRKGRKFKKLRTVQTNSRGVFGLRARHHDKQRYRVQWTAPDGKVWRGPPIRAGSRPNLSSRGCVGPAVRRMVPFAILGGCLGVGVIPALAANQSVAIHDSAFAPARGRRAARGVGELAGRRVARPQRALHRRARAGRRRAPTSAPRSRSPPRGPTRTSATSTASCAARSTSTRAARSPTPSPTAPRRHRPRHPPRRRAVAAPAARRAAAGPLAGRRRPAARPAGHLVPRAGGGAQARRLPHVQARRGHGGPRPRHAAARREARPQRVAPRPPRAPPGEAARQAAQAGLATRWRCARGATSAHRAFRVPR